MENLLRKLKNPPKEYRPIPFWSWNDKLEPDFLKWQINEMDKAGLGGYFMHARGGLETEYLGNDWMECIKAGIDKGNEHGMKPWVYDENGWPSGFAGGLVTAMGDKYHARGLAMDIIENTDRYVFDNSIIGVYILDISEGKLVQIDISVADKEKGSFENRKIIVIRHTAGPFYIDVLNSEAVKAFLDYTHERYYKLFGKEFGRGLQGFFTDEPRLAEGEIPWSYILPEKFRERYGYDLVEVLPLLFISGIAKHSAKSRTGLDAPETLKVRYDFWTLVSELFVTSFMKQIYDWCSEHDCKLTGHVMMEESLYSQMMGTSGSMPFYEYMHVPGMDWLRRTISNPIVPKQVSSVACQLGRKFVLTESYALCGWNVSFEELKWMAEWQFVNGVNLLCQHLEGYTLRGMRKRDYPPSLFFQQPWWEEYGFFNDYISRLGLLLTSGECSADVLLIHPMKSGWVAYDGKNNSAIKKLDEAFIRASETLSSIHFDYHYGDETIIRKYGGVKNNRFIIGKCAYKVVMLPSMLTIDSRTAELLLKFLDYGGSVISIGDFPALLDGRSDEAILRLKEKVLCIGDDIRKLKKCLVQLSLDDISITENDEEISEIRYQQRKIDGDRLYFIVNLDRDKTFDSVVSISGKGRIYKVSMETAEREELQYYHKGGRTLVKLMFLPMQSHVIVMEEGIYAAYGGRSYESTVIKPLETWNIEEADLNSFTLDYCSYSIDGGDWEGPVPVIKLMDLLLELKRKCEVSLKFSFDSDMDFAGCSTVNMVLEAAGEFEISVNDIRLEYKESGWWKDSSFKKVDIKPYVRKGRNEIFLKRSFFQSQKVYDVLFGENVYETEKNKLTYDVELESIYIVGDFGVVSRTGFKSGERNAVYTAGPFVIVDKPQKAKTGDLTKQGFCFFAGAVKLGQNVDIKKENGERLILDIGKPLSVISSVYVNDRLVRMLPWAPFEADITDFVQDGENRIAVKLYSGNRNLLGPHHHINGELYNVGPMSFTGKWSWCERPSEAETVKEEDRRRDYWKEDYYFVEFGL